MDLLQTIDEALQRFAARDLVASAEVVDVLLDLRLLLEPDLDELLAEAASAPAAG